METTTTPPKVSVENFTSRDFMEGEKARLWPKVWQVAAREEDMPNVGDYVVYDVADETIIVVRTREGIKAHHNVCPHRGSAIMEGRGHAANFRCRYHNWAFDLDGKNIAVQDKEDWGNSLGCEKLDLHSVTVGLWGGFVWINMDPDCEPLADYLAPIPDYLDPFELENMRYRWALELVIPANWKVALEAFMEGYHVAATHPQLLPTQGDDYTTSFAHGKHAHFGYFTATSIPGQPSPRLKRASPDDARPGVMEFFQGLEDTFGAIFTDRDAAAAKGIMDVLPADADPMTAFGTAVELGRAAADAEGCGYPPNLSFEALARAGADWHVFPNCVTLPYFDGAVWYRARPNGDDIDSCIFNIWSLKRFGPGQEPKIEHVRHDSIMGKSFKLIVDQDLANMARVQKGMKSRAFGYARPNPVQEVEISNFHNWLETYVLGAPRVAVGGAS